MTIDVSRAGLWRQSPVRRRMRTWAGRLAHTPPTRAECAAGHWDVYAPPPADLPPRAVDGAPPTPHAPPRHRGLTTHWDRRTAASTGPAAALGSTTWCRPPAMGWARPPRWPPSHGAHPHKIAPPNRTRQDPGCRAIDAGPRPIRRGPVWPFRYPSRDTPRPSPH